MSLSHEQKIWLAVLPKVSSVFSLSGSLWIIIEVATEKSKRQRPYHRLLLAMSVYDVLESIFNFGSTWMIPRGSQDIIWAYGNRATCTAQGFFLTLSSAVPLYNAMLSIYYLLVINYNYSDAKLRSFVEPAMHLFCFAWAFGTALYSSLAGLMNNADLWCWIAPLPQGCLDSWKHGTAEDGNTKPCIRGDNIWIYRFGFYFIPLWISIAIATLCTCALYRYVYVLDKATLRYRFPELPFEDGFDRSERRNCEISELVHVMETAPRHFDPCSDEGSRCREATGIYAMTLGSAQEGDSDVDDPNPNNSEDCDDVDDSVEGKDAEEVKRKQAAKATERSSKRSSKDRSPPSSLLLSWGFLLYSHLVD